MVASNRPAPTIDSSRAYARVVDIPGAAFMQDGALYDLQGYLVSVPQFEQPAAESSPKAGVAELAQQSAVTSADDSRPSSAAERMRRSRKRRRAGQRCIPLVVHEHEVDGLVTHGLLDPVARNDGRAIGAALGKLLDAMPPDRWPVRR